MQISDMLQFSMENLQEFVIFFDEDGKILYANKRAHELLEYENIVEECVITDIFQTEFFHREGCLIPDSKFKQLNMDMNAYRKNLTCFPVCGRITRTDMDPHIWCAMGYDATHQVYAARKQEKAAKEVEDALKVRSEFIANVTHELRTPVNGILGTTRELVEKEEDTKKKSLLSLIERGCADMNALINNILDFSKLEAGKFTLESREFNFRDMIEYVQSTHKNKIYEKGLDFLVTVSSDIPETIISDELRIVQVLNNLLSNATKFTSVGRIMLEVVKTAQINNRIELFFLVIDTGIGIDKVGQDKLFKSFSQVDASISRCYGGTGLGLNISKQLVELMDGSIQVESTPGKGTMFSFHIWVDIPQSEENVNVVQKTEGAEEYLMSLHNMDDTQKLRNYGTKENADAIHKKMSKLILSIEMENWEKAEMFMEDLRGLIEEAPEDVRRAGLRLKMAVQKSDQEKTVVAYEKLKELLQI